MSSWIGRTLSESRISKLVHQDNVSSIYLALHLPTNQPVRVRIFNLNISQNADALEALRTQLHPLLALTHPNITRVLAFDLADGQPYLVHEASPGIALSVYLSDLSQQGLLLPLHAVAGLFSPICAAIDHAHAYGLIHRDLKPSNIVLRRITEPSTTPDAALPHIHPVVTNFSIAHLLASVPNTRQVPPYSPNPYSSPEQAQGRPIDGRSDIFSLGAILYELLAGDPPFPETVAQTPTDAHPVPKRQSPPPLINTPTPVVKVVERAMAKKPESRYHRAVDLADEFQTAIGLQPGLQRPATDWTVTSPHAEHKDAQPKKPRRTSLLFLITLTLALIVLAALGTLALIAWRYLTGTGPFSALSPLVAAFPSLLLESIGENHLISRDVQSVQGTTLNGELPHAVATAVR